MHHRPDIMLYYSSRQTALRSMHQGCIGVPDRGAGGQSPPWIWETSKIRADGMGNSGIQGTEFF